MMVITIFSAEGSQCQQCAPVSAMRRPADTAPPALRQGPPQILLMVPGGHFRGPTGHVLAECCGIFLQVEVWRQEPPSPALSPLHGFPGGAASGPHMRFGCVSSSAVTGSCFCLRGLAGCWGRAECGCARLPLVLCFRGISRPLRMRTCHEPLGASSGPCSKDSPGSDPSWLLGDFQPQYN